MKMLYVIGIDTVCDGFVADKNDDQYVYLHTLEESEAEEKDCEDSISVPFDEYLEGRKAIWSPGGGVIIGTKPEKYIIASTDQKFESVKEAEEFMKGEGR